MTLNRKTITGTICITLTAFFWGSSFAVRKIGMEEIGPMMQNAFRFLVAFLFLGTVFILRNIFLKKLGENGGDPYAYQIRNGIIIGVAYAVAACFQQIGLTTVSAGTSSFMTSLYTVMVPLLSIVFYKEQIGKRIWIGIAMSFAGIILISNAEVGFETGAVILLCSALMFALQIILIGRFIHNSDPLLLVIVQVAMGAIVHFVMALVIKETFAFSMLWNKICLVTIIYAGIFSLGIANLLQFIGQKMVSPAITAIICSFESVFGLLFGILLLDETVSPIKGMGCILILSAVIISQLESEGKNNNR